MIFIGQCKSILADTDFPIELWENETTENPVSAPLQINRAIRYQDKDTRNIPTMLGIKFLMEGIRIILYMWYVPLGVQMTEMK